MAKVTKAEVAQKFPQVEEALLGMVYGKVEIEVHNGEIRNVDRSSRRSTLRNGRPIGEEPRASNE